MSFNKNMFREYDIRGIYGTDLDENIAYLIGRSFGSFIQYKGHHKVIIGYDNRSSSPLLHQTVVDGIISTGADVISIGLVTTPMYYFAKKQYNIDCGMMITASHNPKEYNGFKISWDPIGNAYGEQIREFRDFTMQGTFLDGHGNYYATTITKEYYELLKYSLNLGFRKVKVVVDCGNGTASLFIKDILEMLGITYYPLYCESDPEFPNHHPDPSVPANLIDLGNKVQELNYTLGIAFDGDADRVGLVDETGKPVPADMIMAIFYRRMKEDLERKDKKKAIYDVKCSKALIDDLTKMGYQQEMYRTGNSYMNAKINKDDYDFGGEYSGHLWFRDRFPGFDDGIYAGLRIIEIISNTDQSISMLLHNMQQYFSTEEEKVEVTDENKFQIVDLVKQYAQQKGYQMNTIDGVRVEFPDGFALVRASNTGPNLTIRYEARSPERLNEIKYEFNHVIEDSIRNIYPTLP